MTPKDRKRLALDIPRDMHQKLKSLAVQYNISITRLIMQLITIRLDDQKMIDGE